MNLMWTLYSNKYISTILDMSVFYLNIRILELLRHQETWHRKKKLKNQETLN